MFVYQQVWLHDSSAFELSELFGPSQILSTQVGDTAGEPFTQGGPSIADFTLLDEVMKETVEEDLRDDTCSQQQTKPQPAKLELLNIDEWDEGKTYDEDPPSYIHYSIKWKVILNNKLITKDTEQDLVLAPNFYWSLFLRPKLEKPLCKKLSPNKRVRLDDTNVAVSVIECSERNLT